MKMTKSIIAFMLVVLLLVGCAAPATQTPAAQEPSGENTAVTNDATEGSASEATYTSLDDFVLFDADGVLTTTGRDAKGTTGVVSSGKYEASKIGKEIMEKGGNAVDAAVAVGFALGLAEPNSSGLGGGGFMTLRTEDGQTLFIDFRERAPMAATPDMWQSYMDADGKSHVIGSQNLDGGKSVGIPGNVAGLLYACLLYTSPSPRD